jgi:hypothetical protein
MLVCKKKGMKLRERKRTTNKIRIQNKKGSRRRGRKSKIFRKKNVRSRKVILEKI